MQTIYPKSFPTPNEELFLKLVLCDDADFTETWNEWKSVTIFNDINYATMRLLPLVYLRMDSLGLHHDSLFNKIKGIYKNTWVRNQQLLAITKKLIEELHTHNIPVLTLKGIPLLLDFYKNPGARFTGDADLVIPPQYAEQCINIMVRHGWNYQKPWMPDVNHSSPGIYFVTKSTDMEKDGIKVDIHWNIFGIYHHTPAIDIFTLRENLSSLQFGNIFWNNATTMNTPFPGLRPCAEDILMHVMIHGTEQSRGRSLRWVVDAVTIIRSTSIHWDYIIEQSITFHLTTELITGFTYLHEQIHAPIPVEFLNNLKKIPRTKSEITEFRKRSMISNDQRFSPINNLLMFWYAYWKYEPTTKFPKTIFGFCWYTVQLLGMNNPKKFFFIIKKYIKKISRQLYN